MNNSLTLAIVFLSAGLLFTTATINTAAYAGGDDDRDKKKYKDGDGSEVNKAKAEHNSKSAILDCDKNIFKESFNGDTNTNSFCQVLLQNSLPTP